MDKIKGLTEQEVSASRLNHGENTLSRKKSSSFFSMLLDAFKDIWIIILCIALGVTVAFTILGEMFPETFEGGSWWDIVSIIMAIVLATTIASVSEYKNISRADALQEEYLKTTAKVMRDGKLLDIPTSSIVKGDVVLVQAGDKIPVDGVIIRGSLKVTQAALNGEGRDKEKVETTDVDAVADTSDYESSHKVFLGSVATSGEAYLVATVIGDKTELGLINQSLTEEDEDERKDTSSLKLEGVAKGIGKMGVISATLAGILHVVLGLMSIEGATELTNVIMLVSNAIMLMATIVIMAVPEGLPMMNSIVQAMNTESLFKKSILVSNKSAFSDSAYMNILFSDKTGTITQGALSLVEFIRGNGEVVANIVDKEFIESITINNLARITADGNVIGSNNMDRALLEYAVATGYTEENIDSLVESVSGFDSEKKCATVNMKDGSVYWKGATEVLVDTLTHYMNDSGEKMPFTDVEKEALFGTMEEQAKRTMKLLSVAKIANGETVLLATLCLRDDVRADAIETVNVLHKAGINVVMVTGDMETTAIAIAKEANILRTDKDVTLTHEQMEAMSDDELKEVLPKLKVVSRAKPMDKKRLVSIAQSLGMVVGMTGDGVNDAPALKQADVGFAMGDGTAVAKEAGDVVILNNSLTSIKDCVLNSRTMSKSIGKFLIFQLTVNVSCLAINIIAPLFGWDSPFTIVQMLWVNLVMDTLGALAFGSEPILNRYMDEKPIERLAPILTPKIKQAIATNGLFITAGAMLILLNIGGVLDFARPDYHYNMGVYDRTVMFAFFIYAVIFNGLNTRSEGLNVFEHIGKNKKFILIMILIFAIQTLLITFAGAVIGTTPLTIEGYAVTIWLAFLIIPFDLVRKAIFRKK